MTDSRLAQWQSTVADFVLANVGAPRRRVLDVGCGNGWLTRRLSAAGHEAVGVDPDAPAGAEFRQHPVEQLPDSAAFETVVAVTSLHHVADLARALDRVVAVMDVPSTMIVVEFGWEQLDGPTLRWCAGRLPEPRGEPNWLHRCCGDPAQWTDEEGSRAQDHVRKWAEHEGFHSATTMLYELRRRFTEQFLAWGPYLYPDLDGVSADDEGQAITRGDIKPVALQYVGRLGP